MPAANDGDAAASETASAIAPITLNFVMLLSIHKLMMGKQRGAGPIVPDSHSLMKFSSSQARDQSVTRWREMAGITLEMTLLMPPRMAALHTSARVKT
jgi:hypothetical protein